MRIKNVLLIFLAFFLIMVPSVVGAEESDESIVEDTEVDENESGEAKSEESETIETEDETSTNESAGEESTDDTVDHEGETSESKESSNESDRDQEESADLIEDQEENQEKKQLDSEKDSKESTYEEQEDSTLDEQEKEHDSEQDDRIDEKNSSEDTTEETSSEESEDKQTTQSQQNTMSIQSISSDGSYKVGDRAPGISDFKVKLNHIGFNGITVTDYFGDYTEQRVLEFQTYYGLPETGEVEADTLSELNAVYNSPHQLGKSHSENKSIKEKLNALGYGGIKVTNYFGDYTEKRVIEFQRDHNLKAHGIVDAKTLAKLNGIYDSAVRPGESDPILIDVKEKLNSLGFSGIIVTSYYGDYTVQRVKEFQRFADLSANGVLDESTLGALDELAASGYSQGDSHSNIASMKRKLNQVGFSGILVTDYFGNFTEKRVREFQDYYNLSVTGKANQETLDQLDAVYNSSLQVGKSDSDLRGIKEKLNAIGYGGIIVTSYFGDFTEKRVKQFQRDYNLKPHGIIDGKTLNKINDIYDSAIWPGQSDSALIDIKEKLNSLGFGGIIVSTYYGDFTEKRVKEFQDFAGISSSGALDQDTINALDELAAKGYSQGNSHSNIATMKRKLNRVGFNGILVTNYFGNFTEKKVREFQDYYDLKVTGNANKETLDQLDYIYEHPLQVGKSHQDLKDIKRKLNAIGYGGIIVTDYFGGFTETKVKEFQRARGLPVSGIVESNTLDKINSMYEANQTTEYSYSFDRMVDIQMKSGLPKYDGPGKINADEANVRYYLNPANFPKGTPGYLQFMLLDESSSISASELNKEYLEGKGMLANTGSAFIRAGELYDLNEFYLISHALHETGNGTSSLALGVGVDKSGKIVRNSKGDIIRNKNHKDVYEVVYNFYGYGAHDDNPLIGGVNYAFERDWFSPESAVIGGAKNISNNYISQGQNTLYKMKWDPDNVELTNQRGKQYATHIMWPIIQAERMYSMLGSSVFDSLTRFEVPQYKNQPKADSSKPPRPEPQLPIPEIENYFSAGTLGEVTANVNFREGPSTDYKRILTIDNGLEIELIGDNGGKWFKAIYNGKEGWLHSDYVTITFEPVDVATSYPEGTIATVKSSVNFRKGPSTSYESYGMLSSGTSLEALGDNDGNWIKVKNNSRVGWVHSAYLDIRNLYEIYDSDGDNVNYRTAPSNGTAGSPVASLSPGEFVALSLDSKGNIVAERAVAGTIEYNWVRIKINGKNYWMADKFLRKY